jgi:hypothetical protein
VSQVKAFLNSTSGHGVTHRALAQFRNQDDGGPGDMAKFAEVWGTRFYRDERGALYLTYVGASLDDIATWLKQREREDFPIIYLELTDIQCGQRGQDVLHERMPRAHGHAVKIGTQASSDWRITVEGSSAAEVILVYRRLVERVNRTAGHIYVLPSASASDQLAGVAD